MCAAEFPGLCWEDCHRRRYHHVKKAGDFITTNGLFSHLDNHRMTEESLDVYTYDSYPNIAFELGKSPRTSADLNDRKWTRNLIEARSVCPHFGILEPFRPWIEAPERVEVVLRKKEGRRFLFVLNLQPIRQMITLIREAVLLYTGRTVRYGTAVYELEVKGG